MSCEELTASVTKWQEVSSGTVTPLAENFLEQRLDVVAARRALECHNGHLLFGNLLMQERYLIDGRNALDLLKGVTNYGEDKSGDLDLMMAQHLKAKPADPFPGERGFVSPGTYRRFRDKYRKQVPVSCAPLVEGMTAAIEQMKGVTFAELLHVLWRGECKEGIPLAERALMDSSATTRRMGCVLLGVIGTKSHIEKLEILGSTDGYSEDQGRQKIYPVRDACKEAAGKVKLRAM